MWFMNLKTGKVWNSSNPDIVARVKADAATYKAVNPPEAKKPKGRPKTLSTSKD
ncbi:MAG: hypothetical protein LBS74_02900 [Oscillospiraceae bacterium]|jgi:hypothetical protein|nr:hypothetical protein [Oscillospiraceae bacterium]